MLSRHVWLSINGKYCDILSSKPALPANLTQSFAENIHNKGNDIESESSVIKPKYIDLL